MERAYIRWDPDVVPFHEIKISRHPLLDQRGFYCLVAAKLDAERDVWRELEALFLARYGEGTLRSGRKEHEQALALAKAAGKTLVAMLGKLDGVEGGKPVRELLDDVEACLVQRNSLKISQIPASFVERRRLSVVNRGDFAPLNWRSLTSPVAD
jgi:hypothetical protein